MGRRILKIGVTGSAGSGKSLVCKGFAQLGIVTLDCDAIAREVVEPGRAAYVKVVEVFGAQVVQPDQALDRVRLRQMIIDLPERRKMLEDILHPVIIEEMVRQMGAVECVAEPACVVEVPLLFELGMEGYFDRVVVVTSRESDLIDRICARDGVKQSSARKMLEIQMSQAQKLEKADHVVRNEGDEEALFQSVRVLYDKMKKEILTKTS